MLCLIYSLLYFTFSAAILQAVVALQNSKGLSNLLLFVGDANRLIRQRHIQAGVPFPIIQGCLFLLFKGAFSYYSGVHRPKNNKKNYGKRGVMGKENVKLAKKNA